MPAELQLPHNWTPRPYQGPLWRYLEHGGKRAIAIWHRRCLAKGSKVALADGRWLPIEEVQPGQAVLAWNGADVVVDKVANVWRVGERAVRTYRAAGFSDLTATSDHRIYGFGVGWLTIGEAEQLGVSACQRDGDGIIEAGRLRSEDAGIAETWDIETEREGCFFANGWLVHNSGKDEVALHRTACAMAERPATYWHMLPIYVQGRKAIWTAINPRTGRRRIDEAFPHELRANTNEQEMFIRFKNGATWQVVGSDRYDAVVGAPPAGLTFSEWALSNPAAWAYLAPIVEENNGWAVFVTTSRGRNHAKSMLDHARKTKGWFAEVLTVHDTGAIPMSAVENARLEYQSLFGEEAGNALIEQEYFSSFNAAVLGSYWGKELREAEQQGRIGKIDVARDLPVHTAWDIGVDDAMAIWAFQVYPDRLHVVDYTEGHGYGFDHYAKWLDERGYHGTDWVPHDAKVREPGTPGARTRIESMVLLGRKPALVANLRLMDGINAARKTLRYCWFDEERCERGLEALREYKAEYDEEANVFLKTPAHNWASHSSDAFRYLSLGWRAPARPDEKPAPPRMDALDRWTYDDLEDVIRRERSRERV